MPSYLEELETELELAPGTLTKKKEVADKWNGRFKQADDTLAEGTRLLNDAKTLESVVDGKIANFGVNEATVAQLAAQVEGLKAAQKTLEEKGFKIDLNLPEIKGPTPPDPIVDLRNRTTQAFSQIGQSINVSNRYFQVFGRPLPDDLGTLGDEAAAARMSIPDYAEKKYGFAAELKRKGDLEQAERDKKIAEAAVAKYKEDHPAAQFGETPGVPSNFPKMPAPRDGTDFRTFAGLPARQKIQSAMDRANSLAKTTAA